jgi:hypothetical protein
MNLMKILHILQHGEDIAPDFLETAQAMLATLTGDDQAKLKDALTAARKRSDALHNEVQEEAKNAEDQAGKAGK